MRESQPRVWALISGVLAGYGIATNGSAIYERSLGYNVNLEWGLVLLVFGVVIGWGLWEIWSTKRPLRRDEDKTPPESDPRELE